MSSYYDALCVDGSYYKAQATAIRPSAYLRVRVFVQGLCSSFSFGFGPAPKRRRRKVATNGASRAFGGRRAASAAHGRVMGHEALSFVGRA